MPTTVNVMPHQRKANAGDSFCPLAIAGVRTNTEWRKQLLKNIQQPRQAGRVSFLSILIYKSMVRTIAADTNVFQETPDTITT